MHSSARWLLVVLCLIQVTRSYSFYLGLHRLSISSYSKMHVSGRDFIKNPTQIRKEIRNFDSLKWKYHGNLPKSQSLGTIDSETCSDHSLPSDPTVSTSIPATTNSNTSIAPILTALSIVALVLQNSGLSLTMRMSRITNSGNMYAASTAVLISELIKFAISYITYHTTLTNQRKLSIKEMASDIPMLIEISIPSAMYVLQNNLQYIAMSSLPAAIYQVLVQMKIITAAILSKTYLRKQISSKQWLSIFSLTVGVIIVQLSVQSKRGAISNLNVPLGLITVALSCFTSGYAGVKLESTLKNGRESLWVRNLQISIVSILIAALACLKDAPMLWKHGFFSGYSPLVLLVIVIQAVGGILVSLVVKNTSTIVKGFATAASIILTSLISAFFLNDIKINGTFLTGALIVCLSTIGYSKK